MRGWTETSIPCKVVFSVIAEFRCMLFVCGDIGTRPHGSIISSRAYPSSSPPKTVDPATYARRLKHARGWVSGGPTGMRNIECRTRSSEGRRKKWFSLPGAASEHHAATPISLTLHCGTMKGNVGCSSQWIWGRVDPYGPDRRLDAHCTMFGNTL